MRIGFIGLGNMGLPMAINLHRAGYEVTGKNRSSGKEQQFSEHGGKIGLSYAEMAEQMDVIITCLPMPADVEEVYTGEGGLLPHAREGIILIDCSTVSPELNQRLYALAEKAGCHFLDAPVSGGTVGAKDGTLSIMVGGNQSAYKQVLQILEVLGEHVYYTGPSGSGSAVKLINQLMVGIHTQATSEAFALGAKAGLNSDMLFNILNHSFAQSRIMARHYTQFIAPQLTEPGFALKLLNKDINLVTEMASQYGVPLPAGDQVKTLLNEAADSDLAEQDMSSLYYQQLARSQDGQQAKDLKYYAVFLRMLDEGKSAQFREEHLAFLEEMRAQGAIFANGRFLDGAGGLVIYRGHSYEEVEAMVKQDPYIKLGAREYAIHEWDIVLTQPVQG